MGKTRLINLFLTTSCERKGDTPVAEDILHWGPDILEGEWRSFWGRVTWNGEASGHYDLRIIQKEKGNGGVLIRDFDEHLQFEKDLHRVEGLSTFSGPMIAIRGKHNPPSERICCNLIIVPKLNSPCHMVLTQRLKNPESKRLKRELLHWVEHKWDALHGSSQHYSLILWS